MDPILSWVVCLLSAFLLAAGGFLMARAASSRRLARRTEDISKLKTTCGKLMEERQVREARERELKNQLDAAKRALQARAELTSEADGFGGPTELPDPASYFERDSVPHLQKVSEDEFEIEGAAPRSVKEAAQSAETSDELGGHDETKQFNLHSPENVVQFMQRIDELSDENSALKSTVTEHEQTIKDKRAEGNEQIHRFAALDATAEKLRAELKRRNERIKYLEDQLKDQISTDGGPLSNPGANERSPSGRLPEPRTSSGGLPPPPPPAAFNVGKSELGKHPLKVTGPHDGPTLPVTRLSPEDLEGDD